MLTRKRLLEWNPSSDADRSSRNSQEGLAAYCRTMWIGPIIAVAALIYLSLSNPATLGAAGPVLWPLVCLPCYRVVDQPAAHPPRSKADG